MGSLLTISGGLTAPVGHELEIVVFGPGVGECILLHLGEGDWFVVDSCRFPGSKTPAAIEYLESLSIDPSLAIKRILATHWHDDHIKGLGDMLRRCPNAKLAISAALEADQFFQLVLEVEEQNKLVAGSSTATEFADVLDQLLERGRQIAGPDFYASDSTVLFRGGYEGNALVHSLSPSAATITNAKTQSLTRLLTTGQTRRFRRASPNDLSVVAHVSVGPVNLLLGADLENTADGEFGWKAVLASPNRPSQQSEFFKIPHHGSQNADHDQVWSTMLVSDPHAVVTPYSKLKEPLPTPRDLKNLKSRTGNLYATTWPPSSRPRRRPGVDGMIASATKRRHSLSRIPGFVRARFDLTSSSLDPVIDTFGSATKF